MVEYRYPARRRIVGLLPATEPHPARVERAWRPALVVALLATVPAFYLELLAGSPQALATIAYAVAGLAVLVALGHAALRSSKPWRHVAGNSLDLLLGAGLLGAALLPTSVLSPPALILRLAVALLTMTRMLWALRHLVTRGGVIYLLLVALAVLGLCGAGFWWLEPTAETYADGLWLAFTTAATVGYGDIVPTTPAAKIFSVFVVLLGFGVLSVVTAAIATAWVETEERRIEREILQDLRRQLLSVHAELASLRTELRSGQRSGAERP
jgi:voltage-gated potassium channel